MEWAQEAMKQYLMDCVQSNVYDAYQPKVYDRTGDLLRSITSSDITTTITGNTVTFQFFVYFDPSKLNYYSVTGEMPLNIPNLIEEGHVQSGYESKVDYFHNYPARNMTQETVEFINDLIHATFVDAINIEVKKIGGKATFGK